VFASDETSNPFGMDHPCDRAVPGYGAVDADFHAIGDNPGIHGGAGTGVPFTDSVAGDRFIGVLASVGLAGRDADGDGASPGPTVDNCYLSYVYPCVPERGHAPTDADHEELEPFLDAELRAVNAHVLLPVGDRALGYVLREHTTLTTEFPTDAAALHARQLRGRGFLVVPVRDPAAWTDDDREALTETLRAVLASDYRQTKGVATTVG